MADCPEDESADCLEDEREMFQNVWSACKLHLSQETLELVFGCSIIVSATPCGSYGKGIVPDESPIDSNGVTIYVVVYG